MFNALIATVPEDAVNDTPSPMLDLVTWVVIIGGGLALLALLVSMIYCIATVNRPGGGSNMPINARLDAWMEQQGYPPSYQGYQAQPPIVRQYHMYAGNPSAPRPNDPFDHMRQPQ